MEETDDYYISLENIDWNNWNQRLNSPRSIEACKLTGVDPNDLYYVNYETFIQLHPDLEKMPRDFQELRYNHFERMRRENVRLCTEERNKIIKAENFRLMEESHLSKSFNQNKSFEFSNTSHSPYNYEQKAIEQMKNKQKREIEMLLDCETKVEKIKKESEQKEFNEKIREEQLRRSIAEKHRREEELRQKKEKYKQDLLKVEISEQQQRNFLKFLESHSTKSPRKNNLDPEAIEQEEKMIESFRQQNSKTLERAIIMDSDLHEQQKKTIERQRMMMERDKIRKDGLQQKKIENKLEGLKFKEYTNRKIAFAKSQFDEVERKEKLNEEKRKYFNQLKGMANKREKEFHRIKAMDMMKSIERGKQMEKQKMLEFIEKHKKLEEQKRLIDLANEHRSRTMETKLSQGVLEARTRMERQLRLKALNVMKKHEMLEKRGLKLKQDSEREKAYKNEINLLKEEELKYNLLKQQKIQDYFREKNITKMKARNERIEEFRKQKEVMEKQKKNAQDYIIKKKQDDKDFYDKIMRKSNQISLDDLQEMFPGDDKIVEKFIKFKQTKGEPIEDLNLSYNVNRSYDNFGMQRINSESSFHNNSFDYARSGSFNKSFDKIY